MTFNSKDINKIIGKVDRYLTWDSRDIVIGKRAYFFNYDRKVYVSMYKCQLGIWAYYSVKDVKFSKYLRTWSEVNDFIHRVRIIG